MWQKLTSLLIGLIIGAAGAAAFFAYQEKKVEHHYLQYQESIRGGVLEPVKFDVEELYRLKLNRPDGSPAPSIRESSDKVIFVSFWASWCIPCQAEFPEIEALKARVGDGVAFYMLSGEPPDVMRPTADRFKLPFFSYQDEKLLPAYLRTYEVLPRSFIIKNGRIEFERWAQAPWGGDNAVKLLHDIEAAN